MTLEEAKKLMTPEALENLHNVVDIRPTIDLSKKVNNDLLMSAFCKAVTDGVIKETSLNERLVKLLNSETNTISQTKLKEVLDIIHIKQPNMHCVITMDEYIDGTMRRVFEWDYFEGDVNFNTAFEEVLTHYKITPSDVRQKMTATLKSTIVNNVSQLVSRYYKATDEERAKIVISISTIHRLVNMCNGILLATFEEK